MPADSGRQDRAYLSSGTCVGCGNETDELIDRSSTNLLMSTHFKSWCEYNWGTDVFLHVKAHARHVFERGLPCCKTCMEQILESQLMQLRLHVYMQENGPGCADCGVTDTGTLRVSLRFGAVNVIVHSMLVEPTSNPVLMEDEETGDYVCETCMMQRVYCPNCGMRVTEETLLPDGGGCVECVGVFHTIMSWNYVPNEFVTYTQRRSDDRQTYGMEIEVHTGRDLSPSMCGHLFMERMVNHGLGDVVYMKHDGSIDPGFEIVTMPMTYEYLTENKVVEKIYGALYEVSPELLTKSREHPSCGVHIHLGRDGANRTTFAKMAALLYNNPSFTERIGQRNANNYCRTEAPSTVTKALISGGWGARYQAVNFENQHTVEFRHMQNTGNGVDALRYVQIIHALRDWAAQASLRDGIVALSKYAASRKGAVWKYLADAAGRYNTDLRSTLSKKWEFNLRRNRDILPPNYIYEDDIIYNSHRERVPEEMDRVLRRVYIMPETSTPATQDTPHWVHVVKERERRRGAFKRRTNYIIPGITPQGVSPFIAYETT